MTTRIFNTRMGALATLDTPMGALDYGAVFVGPDERTVYEVIEPCHANENGFLFVRTLGVTPVWDERARAWSNEGFFSYPDTTAMYLVLDDPDDEGEEEEGDFEDDEEYDDV